VAGCWFLVASGWWLVAVASCWLLVEGPATNLFELFSEAGELLFEIFQFLT
jgi:hypothetical protein